LNGTVLEAMVTGRYFAERQVIQIVAHHEMMTDEPETLVLRSIAGVNLWWALRNRR